MARLNGILPLSGTVAGLCFLKNGVVRSARRSSRPEFETAPSLAGTRATAREFGHTSRAGKLLRRVLRAQLQGPGDLALRARLTSHLRTLVALDTTHPRGQRQLLPTHFAALTGFDFYPTAPLSAFYLTPPGVAVPSADLLTLTLPPPDAELAPGTPTGATHYTPELVIAALDFTAGTIRAFPVAGLPGPTGLTDTAPPTSHLTVPLDPPLASTEALVVVLGLRFSRLLNGQLYPLYTATAHPLGVLYAG